MNLRNKEVKQYGFMWNVNEDQTYDYCHDIFCSWYDNQFNTVMMFGELHNYYGYFIKINNYNNIDNDPNFNHEDCFHVDILYNTIIDPDNCKWDQHKQYQLHEYIQRNFMVLMEIWNWYIQDEETDIDNIVCKLK